MSNSIKLSLAVLIFFLCPQPLKAQFNPGTFYIGPQIGLALHSSTKASFYDAGGNDSISMTMFQFEQYQAIQQTLGSEPYQIDGPTGFNSNQSAAFGLQTGMFIARNWSLGLSYRYSSYTSSGNLKVYYGDPDNPDELDGELKTNFTVNNLTLNSKYYFGNIWQPLFGIGLGYIWQSGDIPQADFGLFSFPVGKALTSNHLAFNAEVGLSRTFSDKHQLALSASTWTYSQSTDGPTITDPVIQLKYNYLLNNSKRDKELIDITNTDDKRFMYCGGNTDLQGELDSLFADLDSLNKDKERALQELKDNDLAKEVEAIRQLIEALSAFDELESAGEEALDALQDFVGCDITAMKELLKGSQEERDGVIASLKFLSSFLKIYAEKNAKHAKMLNKLAEVLDKQIEAAEKALKEGNIDLALANIEAIKTSTSWPKDVLENILDDLWKQVDEALADAGKNGVKKAIEVLLKKLLGAKAGAAGSIAQDLVNLADLLWKWHNYDELVGEWNDKFIKILKKIKDAEQGYDPGNLDCFVNWDMKNIKSITVTIELICWCPDPPGSTTEGKWQSMDLELEPHDKGNSKTLTIPKPNTSGKKPVIAKLPPKADRPCKSDICYINMNITAIMEDGTSVTAGGFVGVAN